MDHTNNLHLPQWEETDRILRTDFNGAMEAIDTGVKAVNDAVTTLGTTKATAASVTALAGRVSAVESGKADAATVSALQTTVSGKADSASVNAALAAETQARQNADAALQSAMPRIAAGSYIGAGTYGSAHPNTVTFSFAPQLVFITVEASMAGQQQMLAMRGQTKCCPTGGAGGGMNCVCSFTGNSFRWYCTDTSNGASYQFNTSGQTYLYFAIG